MSGTVKQNWWVSFLSMKEAGWTGSDSNNMKCLRPKLTTVLLSEFNKYSVLSDMQIAMIKC